MLKLCVGAFNMHVDAITIKMHIMVFMCRFAEGGYLHGICICDRGEESGRVRMMQPLGFHSSVLILIQLLRPAGSLMCDEMSFRTYESDCTIGWF